MTAFASTSVLKVIRRVVVSILVVATVAAVMRFASALPLLAASAAMVVALGALFVGYCVNLRRNRSSWRGGWALLTVALVVATVSTTWAEAHGLRNAFPVALDWAGVAAALLASLGISRLLAGRGPGRAVDSALEAAMVALACTYVPWALVVGRGADQLDAAMTLLPVAAWIVAVWLVGRLLFSSTEQVIAYRYLGGAFLTLLVVDAFYAGAKLGDNSVARDRLTGVALWAFCLWGVAALHPSLRRASEPADARPSRFGSIQLLASVTIALVAPASLALAAAHGALSGFGIVVAASGLLPLLLSAYLIRQIIDRARAEHRAQHDSLTRLPNRVLFEDRAEMMLAHARRSETRAAVMFLDLDRFKSINDSLGHAAGNQLLQAVAKRLHGAVRQTDTVARMGGDEFSILLGDIGSAEDATIVATKILDLFVEPFPAGSRELHTSASIGIALYPDDGTDIESLLKNADTAMYRAKAHGRNAFEMYTPDLSVRAQAKLSVELGLRHALDRRSLELHYQPQVDLHTGQVVRLEALARWPHPKLGMLSPAVFVPVAEETGLISALGAWALDEACLHARRWRDSGIEPRPIAVNLSARQFSQASIVDTVAEILERHDIPAPLLELEITESIFMRDLERATATLASLRDLGVRCSIDDFGTGFSGLSYLADMPIDSLKIDQSFVSSVRQVQDQAPIIEAIIGLARALGLNVVAEGVETSDQARFLLAHGCTQMQGYLFSPPLPADDIERLLYRDDQAAIAWRDSIQPAASFTAATIPPALQPSEASRFLATICASGQAGDVHSERIAALFAALVPSEIIIPTPSALRTASMRIAAGSFIGLMPLSTGLAAARALPAPLQAMFASALSPAGLDLSPAGGGGGGLLLAASAGHHGKSGGHHGDNAPSSSSGVGTLEGDGGAGALEAWGSQPPGDEAPSAVLVASTHGSVTSLHDTGGTGSGTPQAPPDVAPPAASTDGGRTQSPPEPPPAVDSPDAWGSGTGGTGSSSDNGGTPATTAGDPGSRPGPTGGGQTGGGDQTGGGQTGGGQTGGGDQTGGGQNSGGSQDQSGGNQGTGNSGGSDAGNPGTGGDQGGTQTGGDQGGTQTGGDQGGTQTGGDQGGTQTGGDQGGTQTGGDQGAGNQGGTGGDQGGTQIGGDQSGNAGSGNAGSGNAGSGNAGSGNAGSGNAGSGNAGSGNAGSGSPGNSGNAPGHAPDGPGNSPNAPGHNKP
jgi:diguanylate cyclase (GGDEF)-like protein